MTKQNTILLAGGAFAVAYYLWNNFRDEAPAATEEAQQGGSTMSTTTTPRGYRNNNPLNIRFNERNNWKGKVLANTDGAFEQFISMPYGFRAALYLFRKYIRQGHNTVYKIVSKWAPPTENHTDKYVTFVANKTGLHPHDYTLRVGDAQALKMLAHAMAWYENGYAPEWTDIEEGWELL